MKKLNLSEINEIVGGVHCWCNSKFGDCLEIRFDYSSCERCNDVCGGIGGSVCKCTYDDEKEKEKEKEKD